MKALSVIDAAGESISAGIGRLSGVAASGLEGSRDEIPPDTLTLDLDFRGMHQFSLWMTIDGRFGLIMGSLLCELFPPAL